MDGIWIPIVLFIVLGFVYLGYFYWNNKNRQAVMETVQKSMETGNDLTPDLLAKLGAAINPRARDLRRGVVILSIGIAGLLASMFFADADVVTGLRAGSMFPLFMGAAFLVVWRLNRDQG